MNNNLLGCAALCLAVMGCAKDETASTVTLPTVVKHVRVEASVPVTRTELAPDGYNVLWSPGDTIGVYVRSDDNLTAANTPLVFEGLQPSSRGVFSGDITLAEGASGYTLYAYYPYSADTPADPTAVTFALASRQRQAAAGDSSHLGDSDFLVAGAAQSTTGDFTGLLFRHAFAVVEVDLTGSGTMAGKQVASVMLFNTDAASVQTNGALTDMANMTGSFSFDLTAASGNNTANYTGGSAQINYCGVDFTTAPTLGTSPLKAYLTINPGDYTRGNGRVYVVVRTTDGYTSTYSRPGLVISAAQMKVITQDVATGTATQPAIDLSAGGETANCYVASLPEQEYTFDATTAGNGVITPGLQQAVQYFEGRALSASLAGGVAHLIWQSNPYLIVPGSVRYEDGKIHFTLTERPTELGGNAVVGLYPDAASSEALWSWHIWITDKSEAELDALAETYVMYSTYEQAYGAGTAVMMDRNLGASYKEDGAYARSFRAPLFQWGRKDPFPWGQVVFDEQNVPHTYLSEYTAVQTTGSLGQYAGYTGNTAYATAHPEQFIASSGASSYDWYWGAGTGTTSDFRNNELWGNPTGYVVGQTTTKTLFDPCPPGWKMPMPYVYSAFTKTGGSASVASGDTNVTGTFVQGWNLLYDGANTTYYPGVGYRYDEAGVFIFSSAGQYWTSSSGAESAFGAWAVLLSSTQIYTQFINPRGSGFPVRCMRDN